MSDRPTLKSVSERLDDVASSVSRLQAPEDYEATVVARCARALDNLMEKHRNTRSSGNYSNTLAFNQPHYYDVSHPVARVLDYLRQRHGLPNPAAEVERLRLENGELYERLRVAEAKTEAVRQAMDGAR